MAAGVFQLTPLKHRALDACRHPIRPSPTAHDDRSYGPGGFDDGFRHVLDCLATSWALMLVMFAAGFASLGGMMILTGVMGYETMGRHGHGVASASGVVLLVLAAATATFAV